MTTTTGNPSIEARIGPWLLQARIGSGATATVYRALRVDSGQQGALKLFSSQAAECYLREAAFAQVPPHPNLVHVLECGFDARGGYVVSELVTGHDLAARLGSPLPLERALDIAADLAAGLAHLHAHGKVHGDMKPANVLIDDMGQARISDFGTVQAGGCRTETGSPAYMSPEQVLGRPIDARSDIYSLGVVLHEMLTGSAPFHAEHAVDVMAMQVSQSPPALGRKVPREVAAIVRRCLDKRPRRRYATAREVLAALKAIRPPRSWGAWMSRMVRRLVGGAHAA